jgi:drug/metabolite transporter (DMT)-like permease
MIFLFLSIICSVSIAHLFKYAEEKNIPMFGLFAVNYIVGSGVAFWGCDSTFQHQLSHLLLGLGVVIGVLFVCSYLLMVLTIKKLGVTIPVSLMRLSAVLPTFGSIVFFAEIPKNFQLAGIALAFLSLPLASRERIVMSNLLNVMHNGFGFGLMLFGVFGITNFIFKIQFELIPLSNPYHFLVIVFPVAFLVSAIVMIWQKIPLSATILKVGTVLGVINLFSSYFIMKALQELPGIVFYPMNGIGIILVSAITSTIFWKERLTRNNYIFIALASLALLLIYPDLVELISNR